MWSVLPDIFGYNYEAQVTSGVITRFICGPVPMMTEEEKGTCVSEEYNYMYIAAHIET